MSDKKKNEAIDATIDNVHAETVKDSEVESKSHPLAFDEKTIESLWGEYKLGGASTTILKLRLRIMVVQAFHAAGYKSVDDKARRYIRNFQREHDMMVDGETPLFDSKSALSRIPAINTYLKSNSGLTLIQKLTEVEATVGQHNIDLVASLKKAGLPHTSTKLGLVASHESTVGNGGAPTKDKDQDQTPTNNVTNVPDTPKTRDIERPDYSHYAEDTESLLVLLRTTLQEIPDERIFQVLKSITEVVNTETAARRKSPKRAKKSKAA